MRWFGSSRERPSSLELQPPTPTGATWPAAMAGADAGFGAATAHRLGLNAAFTPEALRIADLITARLVPLLELQASAHDLPHVVDLLRSAARTGIGIGIADGRSSIAPDRLSPHAAGALGLAADDLEPLPPDLRRHVRYLLHAGLWAARHGESAIDDLEQSLRLDLETD